MLPARNTRKAWLPNGAAECRKTHPDQTRHRRFDELRQHGTEFQGRQFNNFYNSDDKQWTNLVLAPLLRFALGSFVALVATSARANLLTHWDLSYFIAKTIADTAIESCTAKGRRV